MNSSDLTANPPSDPNQNKVAGGEDITGHVEAVYQQSTNYVSRQARAYPLPSIFAAAALGML